jgi:hypothetical protein
VTPPKKGGLLQANPPKRARSSPRPDKLPLGASAIADGAETSAELHKVPSGTADLDCLPDEEIKRRLRRLVQA